MLTVPSAVSIGLKNDSPLSDSASCMLHSLLDDDDGKVLAMNCPNLSWSKHDSSTRETLPM